MQKSVTRQLEGMSRVLMEVESAAASRPPSSTARPLSPLAPNAASPLRRVSEGLGERPATPLSPSGASPLRRVSEGLSEREHSRAMEREKSTPDHVSVSATAAARSRLQEGSVSGLLGRGISPPPPLHSPSAAASPASRRGSLLGGTSPVPPTEPISGGGGDGNASVLSAGALSQGLSRRSPIASPEKESGGRTTSLVGGSFGRADTGGAQSVKSEVHTPGVGRVPSDGYSSIRLESARDDTAPTPGGISRISDTLRRPRSTTAASDVGSMYHSVVAGSMVTAQESAHGREPGSVASLASRVSGLLG